MNECQNVQQMLGYVIECTLATACSLAMKSRPPKAELERQISIAQQGIDFIRAHEGVDLYASEVVKNGYRRRNTRLEEVLRDSKGSVRDWLQGLNGDS